MLAPHLEGMERYGRGGRKGQKGGGRKGGTSVDALLEAGGRARRKRTEEAEPSVDASRRGEGRGRKRQDGSGRKGRISVGASP